MNKLKMTLKNISLRWKFFFGFLITSLVPIVGFGVYAYTNTEKILLEQSYGNMEENLARASNNMDMVLDGYESASSLIFMNKQVQDLISVDFTNYGYEDLYYYLKNYFGTMMAINSDVNTFSIYTTNQTIAQDYYFIYKVTEEIEQEEWYRRARAENGKPVFMRGGVNKDGNYVFYLVRSLDYYSYGSLRNVLRMEIDEKHLLGVISEVSRDDEMMILDEENHVVSCADKSLTGRSIYDILEGYEGEIGNNRRDTAVYDGKEMLVSSVTSPQGWKILSLVSVPMLEMNIRTSVKNVIMFGLLATSMLAYSLSRKNLVGRKFWSLLFIFTMYFGGGLVPYYMVLKGIHMLNTFWVFIFPLMMSVYNMILVRSYVESMPESLFEAAKIDGATDLTVFFRLVLPLAKPILMTIGLFVAVNQWNSWFDAYLYTSSQSLKPMQSVLVEILNQYQTGGSVSQQMSNAKSGMTVTPDSIRMAATMVATIPIIMVYPFIQKYFVKGIMLGAVKA